ncbi:MAG: hypothetical protein ACLQJR_04160 [Stellaceae bacterium]
MELTLTRSDLDAMPPKLRHQLLLYLEGRPRSQGRRPQGSQATESKTAASPLERRQVAALLRDISFHRIGKPLRALLDRLAYDDTGRPPTRRKLAAALPTVERARLSQYVAVLNRLASKAAKQPGLRFCCFVRGKDTYAIHPATRQWLRELLPGIERAGKQEEPLWE